MGLKSNIVKNTTYKTQIKNVRIFDHENKMDFKKAKLKSRVVEDEVIAVISSSASLWTRLTLDSAKVKMYV